MRLLILVITASGILASSCTIQKRTFRNGYYVSWNKPFREKKSSEEERGLTVENVTSLAPKEVVDISQRIDTLQLISFPVADSSSEKQVTSVLKETGKKGVIRTDRKKVGSNGVKPERQLETEDVPQRKLDLFAANSLGFSLIYVGLLLLSIAMDLSEVIGCLAIFALLICIAFAIISFVRRKRHPEKYKGTWMSVVALIILAVATTAMFGFLISTL